jgi:hypothetical protein
MKKEIEMEQNSNFSLFVAGAAAVVFMLIIFAIDNSFNASLAV